MSCPVDMGTRESPGNEDKKPYILINVLLTSLHFLLSAPDGIADILIVSQANFHINLS